MYAIAAALLLPLSTARALAADSAAAGIAPPAAVTAAVRHNLTPDDFYSVADLSAAQISPDGLWVAYVVSNNDRPSDEARNAIWMVSWDGSQRLALSSAGEGTGQPKWSPDGRYLAFTATAAGSDRSQIMLLDRRGGEARPLTAVTGDIGSYAWSPDGRRIAFAMQPGDAEKTPKPIVIESRHFKDDTDGYLSAGGRHLYLIDVGSTHVDELTTGDQFNDGDPTWSPDGKRIAFVRTTGKGTDADGREAIEVIDAAPGASPHSLTRPYAPNTQALAWSPDGTLIAFLQGLEPKLNAYIQDRLVVIPSGGGALRALTDKLDRAVMSYAFEGNSSIVIAVEDDRTTYPARIDLNTGSITRAEAAAGSANASVISALSSAAGHTALLCSSDHALAEVYALEAGGMRKLTAHNDAFLAALNLGAVEDIQFKSKDGTDIHGFIVKPPNFVAGKRYPTILWIHGGPNGQDDHSLELDGYLFEPQMFAARGYVVLRVNYRGGSGRGLGFAKAILADWGHKEVEDLLAGVDYLVARGIADKERLGVGGWSYGGILTDYTIASDGRFKAAISGAGSGNQLSTYGSDEYVLQYDNELGAPWKNTALWLKVSYPFFHADRIHTPTLFLGGEKDFNVPIVGGEQMYQALRTVGVPAQLVVYPGQHHVFTRPSFVKDLAERTTAWIERYIPPKP